MLQEEKKKTKSEIQVPRELVRLCEITRPQFACHSAADVGRQHNSALAWQNSHLSSTLAPLFPWGT